MDPIHYQILVHLADTKLHSYMLLHWQKCEEDASWGAGSRSTEGSPLGHPEDSIRVHTVFLLKDQFHGTALKFAVVPVPGFYGNSLHWRWQTCIAWFQA